MGSAGLGVGGKGDVAVLGRSLKIGHTIGFCLSSGGASRMEPLGGRIFKVEETADTNALRMFFASSGKSR